MVMTQIQGLISQVQLMAQSGAIDPANSAATNHGSSAANAKSRGDRENGRLTGISS